MANSEHLEIVRGGVAAIAAWRAAHDERLDLRWADLGGADLGKANLYRADLGGADLGGANLYRASLRSAYLSEAYLGEANLREADLSWADLYCADLDGADLGAANLFGANLRGACLHGANLRAAYLPAANLIDVDLRGADLSEIEWDYTTVGLAPAPEGELIGWGWKSGHLVKMLIPAAARRSCATSRALRAEYVRVLEIDDGALTRLEHDAGFGRAIYEAGEITRADAWDEDRWAECSNGIHFFLSRHEAEY